MTRLRTVAVVMMGTAAAMIALAGPAAAHVTVASTDASQGGYGVVTFRVPTEEADASTTKLQVQLPTDTPLAYAATQPVAGWTATETKTKLATPIETDDGELTEAVSVITWTAQQGAGIAPGQFQQFPVQLGPLPEKASITFKAIQTYSNGEVVRWVETPAPGSSTEPDHPAPVLTLAAASGSDSQTSAAPSVSQSDAPVAAESSDGGGSNTGPIVLSIIALVLAAGALGLGVVTRARRS